MRIKSIVGIFLFCFSFAQAQDTLYHVPDSILLEDIWVSAQREDGELLIQELDLDKLDLGPIPRMENYLMMLPGVEMQSGAFNTNRISIRGIGARSPFATSKLRAYIDNIPITDGVGETSLEDINLTTIGKLNIIKGPASPLYGSALGGTILLKTDFQDDNNQPFLSTSMSYGDFHTFRLDQHLRHKWGEKQWTYINVEHLQSDGYRENNEYLKNSATLFHKISTSKGFLSLFSQYIHLQAQIPSSINADDYRENPQLAAGNWQAVEGNEKNQKARIGLSYQHIFQKSTILSSSIFYSYYNGFEIRPFNVLDDVSGSLGGRMKLTYLTGNLETIIGQEVFQESYNWDILETVEKDAGELISRQKSTRNLSNSFAQLTYHLHKNLSLITGINLNHTSLDFSGNQITTTTKKSYGWEINPFLAASLKAYEWVHTVSTGRGFSTPSLDESINAEGYFLPNIDQESGWNYEYKLEKKFGPGFRFSPSIYYTSVNNLLVNQRDAGGETFAINAGKTRMWGLETSFSSHMRIGKNSILNILGNISLGNYSFLEFTDVGIDYSGNDLTGVAPIKWTINPEIIIADWQINTIIRYVDAIPVNDKNTIYTDPYLIQNVNIQKTMKIGNKNKFTTGLFIENIWNTKYVSMAGVNASAFGGALPRYYYPGRARNINIKVSWNLYNDGKS